jgi:hypothetical protein
VADAFQQPGFQHLPLFGHFAFQHPLEDAVGGDDAGFGSRVEDPHAEQAANEFGPGVAGTGVGIVGEFRVAGAGDGAHPRQGDAIRSKEGGDLEDRARRGVQPGQGGP